MVVSEPVTGDTAVIVAVVPETWKSAAFTCCTASLNVTRHLTLSALVGDEDGDWRVIEVTPGAVVSATRLSWTVVHAEFVEVDL